MRLHLRANFAESPCEAFEFPRGRGDLCIAPREREVLEPFACVFTLETRLRKGTPVQQDISSLSSDRTATRAVLLDCAAQREGGAWGLTRDSLISLACTASRSNTTTSGANCIARKTARLRPCSPRWASAPARLKKSKQQSPRTRPRVGARSCRRSWSCAKGRERTPLRLALPASSRRAPARMATGRRERRRAFGRFRTARSASPERARDRRRALRRSGVDARSCGCPGYHRLDICVTTRRSSRPRSLIVTPHACFRPSAVEGEGRVWGPTAQLYSIRSERNWGIGDFTDLLTLLEQWASRGGGIVGVNPLHALFPHNPPHASPYSPSSRLFVNVLYLDVEAIEDFAESREASDLVHSSAFQARLHELREDRVRRLFERRHDQVSRARDGVRAFSRPPSWPGNEPRPCLPRIPRKRGRATPPACAVRSFARALPP